MPSELGRDEAGCADGHEAQPASETGKADRPGKGKAGNEFEHDRRGPKSQPKPIGLVEGEATRIRLPPEAGRGGDGVIAVSVEPPGGSPTGKPTGQVIYTGKLIRE
ncbi:Anti-sigma-K factor RskA [Methylorubrum extorquens DSM 13060]|uniref:Anti-sigma-K factor RskA n=1 Tax=Methylorubrum extorquens DSM 13060 TaxID=882800 RepID=H1KVE1_METEX|nr:Anti-sigma-K factor RskA [Methylorubrum extorquens DSM 13060]